MVETRQHDRVRLQKAAAPIVAHFPGVIWMPFELKPRGNGKFDKKPALGCRTNDPTSWFTLDAANDALEQYPALAGIGFTIPDGMITLDYDDCRDPATGQLDFEAQSAITQCDSYAYTTISQRGIRITGLNNAKAPIRPGYYAMVTLAGQKIEVFIGQTNHFNTLAVDALPGPRELTDISGFTSNLLGERLDEKGHARPVGDLGDLADLIPLQQVCDTLGKLPNPDGPEFGWEWWNRVAAAVHRCTGGSQEGQEAFDAWSAKSWRYCQGQTPDERWDELTKSPMTAIRYGTLVYLVRHTPGGDPGFRPKRKRRPVGGFRCVAFEDVQVSDLPDFVEERLLEDTLVVVFGPPGAGKTFFVLDLLLHVALGRAWFGREVEQSPAMLFALEGGRGVERRIVAFRQHYRLAGQKLPFMVTTDAVNLLDDQSVDNLIAAIKAQGRELGTPVKVVAIDTLAMALGGGDENTAEAMGPVLTNCHRIREETGGCCVILVHHPGKDAGRGPRGFSGIAGTVSTMIEIEHLEKGKPRRVIIRKQRDLEAGEDFFYRLRPVELGITDRRGKPITSCIVAPITAPAEVAAAKAQTKTVKLTPYQRAGLDALREALQGKRTVPPAGCPAARATTETAWRTAFRARLPADTLADTAAKTFKRVRQALISLALAKTSGELVWLTEDIREATNTQQGEDTADLDL